MIGIICVKRFWIYLQFIVGPFFCNYTRIICFNIVNNLQLWISHWDILLIFSYSSVNWVELANIIDCNSFRLFRVYYHKHDILFSIKYFYLKKKCVIGKLLTQGLELLTSPSTRSCWRRECQLRQIHCHLNIFSL